MPCEGQLFPLMRAAAFIIPLLCLDAAAPLVLVVGSENHDWQHDANTYAASMLVNGQHASNKCNPGF